MSLGICWVVSSLFFFLYGFFFLPECARQNVHSKPIVNPRTHREYPQEGGRLDAKRHEVILAKALDGIWPVGHACAVLCWGTRRPPHRRTAAGGGCPSTALHRHGQL